MIKLTKRCTHCNSTYLYQASGHGCSDNNNEKYCPTCQGVINEALAEVPLKFDREKILPASKFSIS